MNPNKFMKILIACGVTYEQLSWWDWEVIELAPNKYHCIGNHPILRRLDIIKDNIIIL